MYSVPTSLPATPPSFTLASLYLDALSREARFKQALTSTSPGNLHAALTEICRQSTYHAEALARFVSATQPPVILASDVQSHTVERLIVEEKALLERYEASLEAAPRDVRPLLEVQRDEVQAALYRLSDFKLLIN